jgi:hypothetical protein
MEDSGAVIKLKSKVYGWEERKSKEKERDGTKKEKR